MSVNLYNFGISLTIYIFGKNDHIKTIILKIHIYNSENFKQVFQN